MASTETDTGTAYRAGVNGPTRARISLKTLRTDHWWIYPAWTFTIFMAFIIYSTWRAFSGADYFSEPYLSPFYSPCLTTECVEGSADLGTPISWWSLSPALIILIFPLTFRFTCYYYRKAYYRSFWLSPPACAVAEPHRKYTGEARFPLILQNIHRYSWYAILVVSLMLTYDVFLAFGPAEGESDGIHMGLGTLIMLVNVVLLWAYTLGCHSCRHITGGRLRHFSKHPIRYRLWTWVSKLNAQHPRMAVWSMFSVALTDFYVYLLASGAIDDPRFF